jgi:hypothetical protein
LLNAGTYWVLKTVSTMSVRFVRTVMLPEIAEGELAEGPLLVEELADALGAVVVPVGDGLAPPFEQAVAAPLRSRTASKAASRFPTVRIPPRDLLLRVTSVPERCRARASRLVTMGRSPLG